MFRAIPGNNEFLISLKGELKSFDGSERTPVINGNIVHIEMYGKTKKVDITQLTLISWYDVKLSPKHVGLLDTIVFMKNESKLFSYPLDMQMIFTEPLRFTKGLRLIPGYVRYAISKTGIVYDTQTLKIVNHSRKEEDSYPMVTVYDPVSMKYRSRSVHRFLALTWLPNNDPIEKPFINHKDGDKTNYDISNLEWCTSKDNNRHAAYTGLRTDNIKVRVRDILTGEIKEYPAISKMVEDTGINSGHNEINYKNRRVNNPYFKRYEVRTENDHRPWFFDKNDELKAGRFRTTVTYEDGSTKVFNHIKDFITYHKLWNISNNMRLLSQKLIERRPGVMIEIVDHYNQKTIQARNVETDEIFEAPSFKKMAKLIGQTPSRVKIGVQYGPTRISNGWAYRFKSEEPWPEDTIESIYIPRCVLGVNFETGEKFQFDSLREASRKSGLDKVTVKRCCKSGKISKGWKFSYVLNESPV